MLSVISALKCQPLADISSQNNNYKKF